MCFSAPRCAQPGPRGSLLGGRRRARRPPPAPGAPGSPLNGGRRAPGGGRPTTTMPREAVLLLAWLALLLALPAPLLAFPSATPGEVTISESRGRRSEYSEPSSISTEQYVRNRTQEFIYVKENAGGRDQP
ncbi:uncharacterized protein [Anser cygnoides]|uniref:uncharacterized protein isoform X4 n=1 Tax=Anser cygnoides TaxID=8845 RepID=UPI0034D23F99